MTNFIEANIKKADLVKFHREFKNFIKVTINKQMVMESILNKINGKEWPGSYYVLRDQTLPALMGEEASKFLFWCIFNGGDFQSIELGKDEEAFVNYIILNYSEIFVKAKVHNVSPLGFFEVRFTNAEGNSQFNTYILRNDGEAFLMRNDTHEISRMLSNITEYFTVMVEQGAIDYSEFKSDISDLINVLQVGVDRLKYTIDTGDVDE